MKKIRKIIRLFFRWLRWRRNQLEDWITYHPEKRCLNCSRRLTRIEARETDFCSYYCENMMDDENLPR